MPRTPKPAALRPLLLAWYRRESRDLPWRGADSYRVLVSEFMLQQTQVATVLPRFEPFIRRFPDLKTLALAQEDDVRAAWSGLGYYRRARNLHAAARLLVRDHAGAIPKDLEILETLPGVGSYTARALGSIVHGIPRGVVDGNVIRVLARLTAFDRPVETASSRKHLQGLADLLVDPGRPGDWNQAMMELGATVCLPRHPLCGSCPWKAPCAGRKNPERFPINAPGKKPIAVTRAVGVFRKKEAFLLWLRRDPRLLDQTWELPGVDLESPGSIRAALGTRLRETLGRPVRVGTELTSVRHAITHRRITVRAFLVHAEPLPRARNGVLRWVEPARLEELPTSSMTRKVLDRIASGGGSARSRQ